MKFARNVHFQIKGGKETEFNNLFEKEVLPILRKQYGFLEEMTLVGIKGADCISLWDNRKNAETYSTATYPQILTKLSTVHRTEPPRWRPTRTRPATLARKRASGGAQERPIHRGSERGLFFVCESNRLRPIGNSLL